MPIMLATYSTNKIGVPKRYVSERKRKKLTLTRRTLLNINIDIDFAIFLQYRIDIEQVISKLNITRNESARRQGQGGLA